MSPIRLRHLPEARAGDTMEQSQCDTCSPISRATDFASLSSRSSLALAPGLPQEDRLLYSQETAEPVDQI